MSLSQIKVNNQIVTSVDDKPLASSENLVKSGGIYNDILSKVSTRESYDTSKNKLNENDLNVISNKYLTADGRLEDTQYYNVSAYIPIKPFTNYAISNIGSSSICSCWYDENLGFISAAPYPTNGRIIEQSPENAKFLRVSYAPNNNVQVEEGNSVTTYEPYLSKEYILGKLLEHTTKKILPEDIFGAKIGRNIFNKYTVIENYGVNSFNGNLFSDNSYFASDYIEIEPSTFYSCTPGASGHYAWYNENKAFISGESSYLNSVTSPQNAKYLRLDVYKAYIDRIVVCNGVARKEDFQKYEFYYDWLKIKNVLDAWDFYKYDATFVNMFNKYTAVDGYYVNETNGDFLTAAAYFRSDYIPVEAGVTYKVSHNNRYAVYDENLNFIEGGTTPYYGKNFTVPTGGKYAVVCYSDLSAKDSFIFAKESEFPAGYESYGLIVPWIKPKVAKSKYDGKKLICFGDSITAIGYTDFIKQDTGINAINVGLSSGRYAYSDDSNQYVNGFAFHNIIDSIVSGDWTIPESINGVSGYETQYQHVEDIKNTDFSTVDFVSIAYGTNDFSSATPLDNENDKFDTNTFKGAIRYCLKNLIEEYPHLKIIGVTPCYRFWTSGGVVVDDSDTHEIRGMLISQYVQAIIDVYNEFHLPVVNNYDNAGINQYNRLQYFNISDGLHPNDNGRGIIGHRIAAGILKEY